MFSAILGLAFYDWSSNKVKGHYVLGKSAEQADKNHILQETLGVIVILKLCCFPYYPLAKYLTQDIHHHFDASVNLC
tara:strand:- start:347 stop:577 length:231 start_codon:yes stop_codon:yes gene_type:complete